MNLNLTILIDTREQLPLEFPGFETLTATLQTGDYSVICDGQDLRDVVAIERKSLSDMLGCIGASRERFERELVRLQAIRFHALVIECPMIRLVESNRFSTLTPRQVMGSLLAWVFKYQMPIIFADNRDYAAATVRTLLFHAARYAIEMENGDEC